MQPNFITYPHPQPQNTTIPPNCYINSAAVINPDNVQLATAIRQKGIPIYVSKMDWGASILNRDYAIEYENRLKTVNETKYANCLSPS